MGYQKSVISGIKISILNNWKCKIANGDYFSHLMNANSHDNLMNFK